MQPLESSPDAQCQERSGSSGSQLTGDALFLKRTSAPFVPLLGLFATSAVKRSAVNHRTTCPDIMSTQKNSDLQLKLHKDDIRRGKSRSVRLLHVDAR